jgi:ergothioneine biosynthesis protein EgtB
LPGFVVRQEVVMTNPGVSARGRGGSTLPSGAAADGSAASRDYWLAAYRVVREETERRAAPLSDEDQMVQSMPDASPIKWHRAHATWFFEHFLLLPQFSGYQSFDPRFGYLFNSYYVAAGPRQPRPRRGMITRPDAADVTAYRAHVDAAVGDLIANVTRAQLLTLVPVIEIGLHHEQQHQELMLTDVLHAFAHNPTSPAYDANWRMPAPERCETAYLEIQEGIRIIGHDGTGFAFDNELPAHRALVGPVRIARNLVTNAEWLDFMADGGYRTPTLWLSDGWAMVEAEGLYAPGYWTEVDGEWFSMTLAGMRRIEPDAPACHVSYYEADAFARWAGKHLPSEFEWEVAARSGRLAGATGLVWQWTRSAYGPYPGYRPAPGALGEYNSKFMINQMVLRGGSSATPDGHTRHSYRNFFYPSARWQFSGLRLVAYD